VRFDLASGLSDSEREHDHLSVNEENKKQHVNTRIDASENASGTTTLLGLGLNQDYLTKTKEDDQWTKERYEAEGDITSNIPPSDKLGTNWKSALLSNES
jgi:hypothetical protein